MTNPDGYQDIMGGSAGSEGSFNPLAILPAIGGFYDTYQTSKTARENTDKTLSAQKAEAELAYQRQVEMWHMQNEYNSPQQQMERFGAAGLNPHLIYGQGNPGNTSGTPQYQPPQQQFRYAAPTYGAAVGSILPTLMAVGTWMQNMRMTEVDIQSKKTNVEKAEQIIAQLNEMNPRKIQELDNRLSLYPYQRDMAVQGVDKANWEVNTLFREYLHKFGDEQYKYPAGGIRGQEFLQQEAKTRLERAKASFTDLNITDPQALMQMVLGGVMGMAGQQLRINQRARNAPVKTEYIGKGQRGRWSLNQKTRNSDYRVNRVKYGSDYYFKP